MMKDMNFGKCDIKQIDIVGQIHRLKMQDNFSLQCLRHKYNAS